MSLNRQIWKISYPVFLSLLAQNVINVTDTAFLGRVGEVELGASALGGLFYVCAFTVAFGFSVGSQILIARRNGEGEYGRIGSVVMQGILFLLALALLMFVLVRFFAAPLLGLFISSGPILDATADFLRVRAWGFFFSFTNVMFRAFFVGITRTKALTFNACLMAGVNILLDYLFIFGHAGFPAMGLEGAAIASVIAEASSILFFIIYTPLAVDARKYGLNRWPSLDFRVLKRILDISVFTMLQSFISMSTYFYFFVVIEHLGQVQLAVANIVRSIYLVMFIPSNALSTAANTLVSNAIGAGRSAEVMAILRRVACVAFGVMAVFSALFCLFPEAVARVYTNDAVLVRASVSSIYVISAASLLCALGSAYFNGVSGTGNTRKALQFELCTLFFYVIYVYVVGIRLRLPVAICYTAELVYFGFMLLFCSTYMRSGRWKGKRI
ncbi:MAG: MATE family efflux transporter [Tannerella sp.]|nr:MATE family efflux transporter [Tannerella sp.]